jgi:putative transposase
MEPEVEALRRSVARGRTYGLDRWALTVVQSLGLQSTLRPRGRLRKQQADDQAG